jgi:hypothetical protein
VLLEVKPDSGSLLLRVLKTEPATQAGRKLEAIVIAACQDDARQQLLGKVLPVHLCKGVADAQHCTCFASFKALHVDAMRVLSHTQAVGVSWMRAHAAGIRADDASCLAGKREGPSAAPSLSDLSHLASISSDPGTSNYGLSLGPKKATAHKAPAVVGGAPKLDIQPGDDERVKAAKLATFNEAVKRHHGLPASPVREVSTDVPAKQAVTLTREQMIAQTHLDSPGLLCRKWVLRLIAAILKRTDGATVPVLVHYVDVHLRPKCKEARMYREFENLALGLDHLLEYKDLWNCPALARAADVFAQRFKSMEFVLTQLSKPNLKPSKKKKIWLAAMGFELAAKTLASFDTAEASAVIKDFGKERKIFGGGNFELSDAESDTDSSEEEQEIQQAKKRKKNKKSKSKKKAKHPPSDLAGTGL